MKKWLLAVGIVAILVLAVVFLFFPARETLSESLTLTCNVNAASKFVESGSQWVKWWPAGAGSGAGEEATRTRSGPGSEGDAARGATGTMAGGAGSGDSSFTYQGLRYRFAHGLYHTAEVRISDGNTDASGHRDISGKDSGISSLIALIPLDNKDSLLLHWECNLDGGWDPISRIKTHRHAERIRSGMKGILSSLRAFLEKEENVYGMVIRETSTRDTFLVAVRSVLPAYPGTADIYGVVNKLKAYSSKQGAMQTGYPMLNVTKSPDGQFKIMIAVPINKIIPAQGEIFSTRLVPGRFLVGDVRGDAHAVDAAEEQMQHYISNYHRTAMAIPFQSLVTDRSQEVDSAKWVTRLYYPIF